MAFASAPKAFQHTVEEPLNREPSSTKLVENYVTEKIGYDRNHGPIPVIDGESHRVTIDGAVRSTLSLSVADLQALPQHTVVCALQCAGNRRHTMRTKLHEVQGVDWFDAAVMNCEWTGPRLRDVLLKAGVSLDEKKWKDAHAAFACYTAPTENSSWYGGSIPLDRAMRDDADVILAVQMNGETLSPNHGYPVRVIVPGIAGARSVKWVERVTVQMTESENYYQKYDYKVLPPDIDSKEAAEEVWDKVPALMGMPVNSAIGVPTKGSRVERDRDGHVLVKGYALPGCDSGPITKVEVSGDDGKTWQQATILDQDKFSTEPSKFKWAWCLWEAHVRMQPSTGKKLLSRATDQGGNQQQETCEWNLRGVAYNGYGETDEIEVV